MPVFLKHTVLFALTLLNGYIAFAQKDKVIINNADSLKLIKNEQTQTYDQQLIGNVFLIHEDTKIFCDSAIKYEADNLIEAYGDVHIVKGDTVHLHSEYINYSGNTSFVKARKNVKLIHHRISLFTEELDFDMTTNIAYYNTGGKIVDSTNVLTSKEGIYYSGQRNFLFKDNVKITTSEYEIYTDSIRYNTDSRIAYFISPTEIIGDSVKIYSERGTHNTTTNISTFTLNNRIEQNAYTLVGDSLYYDKNNGIGKAYFNAKLIDTVNQIIANGHYILSREKDSTVIITDSALLIQIAEGDSIFTHSDTIKVEKDSLHNDVVKAFHHVKFYRSNMQGRCDSMVFTFVDSMLNMYNSPVIWSEGNQITADSISIKMIENKARYVYMDKNAFIISVEDSAKYNQMKGRKMIGTIDSNQLKIIDVFGNGESLYYVPGEEEYVGINIIKSSNIHIELKNSKAFRITFLKRPVGTLYPMFDIDKINTLLRGFKWLDAYRPKSKYDIFIWKDYVPPGKNERKRKIIEPAENKDDPMPPSG